MYNLLEHPCLIVFPFLILVSLSSIQVVNNLVIVISDVAIVIFIVYYYIIMMLQTWLLNLHKLSPTLVIILTE